METQPALTTLADDAEVEHVVEVEGQLFAVVDVRDHRSSQVIANLLRVAAVTLGYHPTNPAVR